MKLTDEQREFYRKAFITGNLQKYELDVILSSEKAWKEEAERLRAALERIANGSEDFNGCINTAIEALSSAAEPTGVENVRESVQWFAEHMEKKLVKNDHRGGWKDCKNTYLLDMLREHVKKLEDDLINRDDVRIIPSAADVGAISMMIADNTRRINAPEKEVPKE